MNKRALKAPSVNREQWLLDTDIRAVVVRIVQDYRASGNGQEDVKQIAERAIVWISTCYRRANDKNVTFYLYRAQGSAGNIVRDIEANVQERPKSDLSLVFQALSDARKNQQRTEREYAYEYAAHLRAPRMAQLQRKVRTAVEDAS